jgi:hypothetical protein
MKVEQLKNLIYKVYRAGYISGSGKTSQGMDYIPTSYQEEVFKKRTDIFINELVIQTIKNKDDIEL